MTAYISLNLFAILIMAILCISPVLGVAKSSMLASNIPVAGSGSSWTQLSQCITNTPTGVCVPSPNITTYSDQFYFYQFDYQFPDGNQTITECKFSISHYMSAPDVTYKLTNIELFQADGLTIPHADILLTTVSIPYGSVQISFNETVFATYHVSNNQFGIRFSVERVSGNTNAAVYLRGCLIEIVKIIPGNETAIGITTIQPTTPQITTNIPTTINPITTTSSNACSLGVQNGVVCDAGISIVTGQVILVGNDTKSINDIKIIDQGSILSEGPLIFSGNLDIFLSTKPDGSIIVTPIIAPSFSGQFDTVTANITGLDSCESSTATPDYSDQNTLSIIVTVVDSCTVNIGLVVGVSVGAVVIAAAIVTVIVIATRMKESRLNTQFQEEVANDDGENMKRAMSSMLDDINNEVS